ncbi:MAG: EAL domain-containing protein [Nocardioidaceae bacterium]
MQLMVRGTYAVVMASLAVTYVVVPDPPRYLWTVIGVSSVLAVVTGLLLHRPRRPLAWWLVAAGLGTFIAGDIVYDLLAGPTAAAVPYPSVADVLYLCTYPLFAAGLVLLVRARSRERDHRALTDALVVTIGLGLLAWVFLAAPYLRDRSLSPVEHAFSIAYPLGDVLLLAVLARLLLGGGRRSTALLLLTTGTIGLLSADVAYGLVQLNGSWQTGGPVDVGWIVFYIAWGAAALHPDMRRLTEPVRLPPPVLSRPRLLLLGSISLLPPGLLLGEALTDDLRDVVVIALASAAMFALVIVRLSGLVQVAGRATRREALLRSTGESLVAASSRAEIHAAGARAISSITEAGTDGRPLVVMSVHGAWRVVHDPAWLLDEPTPPAADHLDDVVARHEGDLCRERFVLLDSGQAGSVLAGRLGPGVPVLLAALLRSGGLIGTVVVAGRSLRRPDVVDAVCAMAAQMSLALESAGLTEEVLQRQSEAQFRSLVQNSSDIILVVDADLRVRFQTPSVRAVLGHEPDAVAGRPVLDLASPGDVPRASLLLRRVRSSPVHDHRAGAEPDDEWRLRDAAGAERVFEVTCSNLLGDPYVRGLVLTLHETTERRALEQRLTHLAFHDPLTSLPNRTQFVDRVAEALATSAASADPDEGPDAGPDEGPDEGPTVLLIDLDDFKVVNDTLGHGAGDALLVAVAERLRSAVGPSDVCARLGGDEFAVLSPGTRGSDDATRLADVVLASLRRPYRVGADELTVRASMGVSTGAPGVDAAELLVRADLAMYAAKDAGKARHERYRPSLQDVMHGKLTQLGDLHRGLDEDQFVLHYQPIVELASGRVVGAEALVRWQHPDRGLVFPGEFIDVVEQGDLAVPFGLWVIETAVAQAVAWQRFAPVRGMFKMSVNVAPRQLADPLFFGQVVDTLDRYGLEPRALTLEITERMLTTQDDQVVASMRQLKHKGVGLAVDDFGTGYAALGYLRRFPVSTLKIDRSFVNGVDVSDDDRALVNAVLRLGETLDLDLVAEGIETPAQRDALVALGCERGQGFLFSRGLPAEEATALLGAQAPARVA